MASGEGYSCSSSRRILRGGFVWLVERVTVVALAGGF